jgi:nucleoside-diphosphate-sugar epimerase
MKRALVTGGTGFVGRAIVRHLRAEGLEVDTLGRGPECDVVSDLASGAPALGSASYDLIVHAAGKAHVVPTSDAERAAFYAVNQKGTRNLLAALDQQSTLPNAFVLISTVAVYGLEAGEGIDEEAALLAEDPYGESKAAAERIVRDWGVQRGVRLGILRLPLVAGVAPPGNLGAMIRAMKRGRYMGIGDSTTRRSIVLVDDVAAVIPRVAEVGGIYNLTDGVHPSFAEIEAAIADRLALRRPKHLPLAIARIGGWVGDAVLHVTGRRLPLTSRTVEKMTSTLTLSDDRARNHLEWAPHSVLAQADEWVR